MTDTTDTSSISSFLSRWTEAERQGDIGALDTMLTDDFVGVGPLGFTLSKAAWLARFHQGLRYQSLDLTEVEARPHGDLAIVTARQRAQGSHAGAPIPEAARVTVSVVKEDGALRIAAIHLSFIAGTPGAPPLPSPGGPVPARPQGVRP